MSKFGKLHQQNSVEDDGKSASSVMELVCKTKSKRKSFSSEGYVRGTKDDGKSASSVMQLVSRRSRNERALALRAPIGAPKISHALEGQNSVLNSPHTSYSQFKHRALHYVTCANRGKIVDFNLNIHNYCDRHDM